MPAARAQARRRSRPRAARASRARPEPSRAGAALVVALLDRQRRHRTRPARLRRVLHQAAAALGVGGELALVLTGDGPVRRLNARYRGKDQPTDVLSFPGDDGGSHRRQAGSGPPAPSLGDIVISVPAAARNARSYGRSLLQELDVLALHGFLHVLGYDHETDDGTMDRLERRLRRELL
jgi:probable rRNA maturation factor